MGSFIEYNQHKKDDLFNFLEVAKPGQSLALEFDIGHRDHILQFIKYGKKTAFGYFVFKYWWQSDNYKGWSLKCTKDNILWHPHKLNNKVYNQYSNDYYCDKLRGFLRVGLIPGYNTKYWSRDNHGKLTLDKDGNREYTIFPYGVAIKKQRGAHIVNFNGTETAAFEPMRFDWEGNLLNKIPYRAKKKLKSIKEQDREINNRNARANYSNTRVVNLLKKEAFDKLEVKDIFSLRNVTYRTQLINHYGMETVLDNLRYTITDDQKINNSHYQLLSVEIPDTRPGIVDTSTRGNFLKMINPSTDEVHIEGVSNTLDQWGNIPIETVYQALSWRDGDRQSLKDSGLSLYDDNADHYIIPTVIS